ncbi:MAG: hypothetical protein EA397_11275 [Deltaproteobacteria bacterium]|nr:MAG: hypothetical protein EA397_11275 [Deltaproteobacteria bacterium]
MRLDPISAAIGLLGLALLGLTSGCADPVPPEVATCNALCGELFTECQYRAFPTMESCLDGCGYYESRGVDIESHRACVEEAACDTFAIVECENAHAPR